MEIAYSQHSQSWWLGTTGMLRILASIKLYLNSEFYDKHPSFVKVMNSYSGVFNNVGTFLA